MDKKYTSFRCPHCGKVLAASDLSEYVYQCEDCDEDFYGFEAVMVTAVFSEPTPDDQQRMNADGLNVDLSQTIKVSVENERNQCGYCFMQKSIIEQLGLEYIKDHVKLEFSEVLHEFFVRMSQNDFYNDLSRNPEKVIPVSFVEVESGTGREIYKDLESGRFYLREVSHREPFAKWLICGKRILPDCGNEPRANLIFLCNDQTEKVTYDDWSGVCAYSNTFNPCFRPASTKNT